MISEGSNYNTDENKSQQKVSSNLKQKKIREKLRGHYDAGISKPKSSQKIFLYLYQQNFIIIINYSIAK